MRVIQRLQVALVLLVAAAPLLLGSAFGAAVTALGAEGDHFCACGMEPGTCGCPACAKLGKLRAESRAHDRQNVVARSSCDDSPAPPGVPSLPESLVPESLFVSAPSSSRLDPPPCPAAPLERGRARPPTPPPRSSEIA
jgi:hypothetical protein